MSFVASMYRGATAGETELPLGTGLAAAGQFDIVLDRDRKLLRVAEVATAVVTMYARSDSVARLFSVASVCRHDNS